MAALKQVGVAEQIAPYQVAMFARMVHEVDGTMHPLYYGRKEQVPKLKFTKQFFNINFDINNYIYGLLLLSDLVRLWASSPRSGLRIMKQFQT